MAAVKAKPIGFIDQIRQAIDDCGESRYAISKATGVSQASLCRFVNRQLGLSMDAIDSLADYLNLYVAVRGKRTKGR